MHHGDYYQKIYKLLLVHEKPVDITTENPLGKIISVILEGYIVLQAG